MIKIENLDSWGFEHAIRGMRNPMNSWDKSDSGWGEFTDDIYSFDIGNADLELMKRLYKAGTEHRKYLRQIAVSMDITAPLYWWKEFDTYKVGTTANSCSTMHKIHAKEFELDDFSHEHLRPCAESTFQAYLDLMNTYRVRYLKKKDKEYWWQMIQMLPSSYNQRRTITMNYENVVTIIKQRKNHKLDEWNQFIEEMLKLPYIREIIGYDDD